MATYTFVNHRVLLPSAKIAEKNPDYVFTIKGEQVFDEDGNEMSITSKTVTRDMVKSPGYSFDFKKGILTLPDGRKGRRPSASANEDDVLAAIAAALEED